MIEQTPRKDRRRSFPFDLQPHISLKEDDTEGRWKRVHEKKRLAAYLKGNSQFAHGREPAHPIGFRPIMWNTVEK